MTKNHPFLVFYQKKTRVFEIIQVFIWVFKRYLTVLTGKKVKVAGGASGIYGKASCQVLVIIPCLKLACAPH